MLHLDGDALVYLAGFAADSRDGELSHSLHNCKLMINLALKDTEQKEHRIFLTSKDPKVNFRYGIYPEYKASRKKKCKVCDENKIAQKISKESYVKTIDNFRRRYFTCLNCDGRVADNKPVYYSKIRQYLVEQWGAWIVTWGEADDWLAVGKPDVIATHDKDIYQAGIPIYNLKSKEFVKCCDPGEVWLDEKKKLRGYGFKWFCVQLLLGDPVDNIPKPYRGDGPVFIEKLFGPLQTMYEAFRMSKLYYELTGNEEIFARQCQLLWVSRRKHQIGSAETIAEVIKNGR